MADVNTQLPPWQPPQAGKLAKPAYEEWAPPDVNNILKTIDPARIPSPAKHLMFPDLPKYVNESVGPFSAGLVSGATLGAIPTRDSSKVTAPQRLMEGAGYMLGAGWAWSTGTEALQGLGVGRRLAGAMVGMSEEEIRNRGHATVGNLIVSGTLGTIFAPMAKVEKYTPSKPPGGGVLKEDLLQRIQEELATGNMSKEQYHSMLSSGQFKGLGDPYRGLRLRDIPDRDVRELTKAWRAYRKEIPRGEVDLQQVIADFKELRDGGKSVEDVAASFKLGEAPPRRGRQFFGQGPDEEMVALEDLKRRPAKLNLGVLKSIRQPKHVAMDVEHQLEQQGIKKPFYQKFVDVDAARVNWDRANIAEGQGFANDLKGMGSNKEKSYLDWLVADDRGRVKVERDARLGPDDVARLNKVHQRFDTLLKSTFGDQATAKEYFSVISKLRAADGNLEKAFPTGHIPQGLQPLVEYASMNELRFTEPNIRRFLASHVRSLTGIQHWNPAYHDFMSMLSSDQIPGEAQRYFGDWLRNTRGGMSQFTANLQGVYKKAWAAVGANPSDHDVRNVLNYYVDTTHLALAGFSPRSLLKVAFHPLQTGGPRIGYSWMWSGMRKALTPAGRALADAAGMGEDTLPFAVDLGVETSRIGKKVEAATQYGLKWHSDLYRYNRRAMFLGMYDKVTSAVRRVGRGAEDETILREAGLYPFHPIIRRDVLAALRAPGTERASIHNAAQIAGVHAAQDTQWMYRRAFRPTIIGQDTGRAFGAFGVWPLNAGEYMRQMFWTLPMPGIERAKWISRHYLGAAAVLGAFGVAGASVGMGHEALASTESWTVEAPWDYGGGPLVDTIASVPRMFYEANNGRFGLAKQQGKEIARTVVPFPGVAAQQVAGSFGTSLPLYGPNKAPGEPETPVEALFRLTTGIQRRGR